MCVPSYVGPLLLNPKYRKYILSISQILLSLRPWSSPDARFGKLYNTACLTLSPPDAHHSWLMITWEWKWWWECRSGSHFCRERWWKLCDKSSQWIKLKWNDLPMLFFWDTWYQKLLWWNIANQKRLSSWRASSFEKGPIALLYVAILQENLF